MIIIRESRKVTKELKNRYNTCLEPVINTAKMAVLQKESKL